MKTPPKDQPGQKSAREAEDMILYPTWHVEGIGTDHSDA